MFQTIINISKDKKKPKYENNFYLGNISIILVTSMIWIIKQEHHQVKMI